MSSTSTAPVPVLTVPTRIVSGLPVLFCDADSLTSETPVADAVAQSPFTPAVSSGLAPAGVSSVSRLSEATDRLEVLTEWAGRRRFVWADGHATALIVTAHALVLPLDPATGLTPDHVAAASVWVRTGSFTGLSSSGAVAADPTASTDLDLEHA